MNDPRSPSPSAAPGAAFPFDDDSHLREHQLTSTQVYRGHFLDVRSDRVSLPDGAEAGREYIVHPGAVMIVPLLDDGQLVLERQFRYPMQRAMVEFPAGKLEPGEPTLPCAVRELFEETGYTAREWAFVGELHNAIAYSNERIEVWFARGLQAGTRQLDDGEFLDVFTAHQHELESWVLAGQISDAKTLIGLLWLQLWRAGRLSLDWQIVPNGVGG